MNVDVFVVKIGGFILFPMCVYECTYIYKQLISMFSIHEDQVAVPRIDVSCVGMRCVLNTDMVFFNIVRVKLKY
jgi:hypothetical protein